MKSRQEIIFEKNSECMVETWNLIISECTLSLLILETEKKLLKLLCELTPTN